MSRLRFKHFWLYALSCLPLQLEDKTHSQIAHKKKAPERLPSVLVHMYFVISIDFEDLNQNVTPNNPLSPLLRNDRPAIPRELWACGLGAVPRDGTVPRISDTKVI